MGVKGDVVQNLRQIKPILAYLYAYQCTISYRINMQTMQTNILVQIIY